VGNPSDGYFGKTIAIAFTNFQASVTLYESPELEILPNTRDHSRFSGIKALAEDVRRCGYYGGIRLLKATVKRFYDYCCDQGIRLSDANFTLRYESTIPHMVGLAGSSAIITAGLRALMTFYGVNIPRPVQPNLVLAVEKEELGIAAGLQDRVAQVYQGVVYMDFDRTLMERRGYGEYEHLPIDALPPLYIAYREDLSEGSEVVHSDFQERFKRGDAEALEAIECWKNLTDRVRACLLSGQGHRIGPLLNANFDKRAQVCRISPGNLQMITAARSVGASAKFTGSGGAIIGTYEDEKMFAALKKRLEAIRVRVFKPVIAPPAGERDL